MRTSVDSASDLLSSASELRWDLLFEQSPLSI
jgi:hypothetical protein